MKRITAAITALLMLFAITTQPARAFAPVAVLAAPQVVTAGGSYAVGALAGLVGLIGMYLTIQDANENAVRIPLGPNANNQPPAPDAPSSLSPTAPYQSACETWIAAQSTTGEYSGCQYTKSWTLTSVVPSGSYATCNYQVVYSSTQCPGNPVINKTVTDQYTAYAGAPTNCPSGYTLNGSTCELQNARQATDDKTCDILFSSGQFATADDMNCGSSANGSKISPILRNGKAIAYGTNSSGQPLMWEVTPGTSRYTLRQYEQVQTATQTQVQTTTVTVDAATSEITSVQTQTSPGAIETPGSESVPTEAAPTTENTPTVTQDATKPADKITCGLPGTPPCAIDDTGFANRYMPPSTSTYNPDLNKQKDIIENIEPPNIGYGWLPSLLPGDAVACHPIQFRGAVNVGEVNLDSTTDLDLCPYLEIARNILGWLFGVVSVIYIWRRFAGARGGGV